jgi:hypothetical protein
MPYKDPHKKREWESKHRSERLARRRELRRSNAARKDARPRELRAQPSRVNVLVPVVAAGALAAYNPKLAVGVGGLTLLLAAIYKKGWSWWIVGALILALGLFFHWSDQSAETQS